MPEIRAKCESCGEISAFDVEPADSAVRECPNCGEEVAVSSGGAEESEGYE